MIPISKTILTAIAVPLAFVGCSTTDPKASFEDVSKSVAERSGQTIRWMLDDESRKEIDSSVEVLLSTELTPKSAVAIALLNNRTLQAEFESIGISQSELAQASRLRNPEFAGSWRWPNHAPTVLNAEYSLAQDFLDLLTLPARKRTAARNLEATKLTLANEVLGLAAEAQTAFFTLQAREQLTDRLQTLIEVNEAAADVAKRQHEAGNINELELQTQQVGFTQSRLELARARAQARSDRERLNRLLGLWGKQTAWTIAKQLPVVPQEEDLTAENIEGLAVSGRLDLQASRLELENVLAALRLKEDVRWIPAINIGVDAEHDLDHSWVIGPTLALEIPVFDQGQPALARLAAEYRRAQRNFEALAINIRSEVREARDTLIAARDAALYHSKILLPQRQNILRQTLLHYNAMQLSNFELLAAKEREQLAEQQAIEALRDYWLARVQLARAVGGSLTPPEAPVGAPAGGAKEEAAEHKHSH